MNSLAERTTKKQAKIGDIPEYTFVYSEMLLIPVPVVVSDREINRIASCVDLDIPNHIWTIARHFRPVGIIGKSELYDIYNQTGLYNRNQMNAFFRKGEGVFWTCTKDTLILHGIKRVAHALSEIAKHRTYYHADTTAETVLQRKPGDRPVNIPLWLYFQKTQIRRARIDYAAWFGDEGLSMRRDVMCSLWDVTKKTLIRWEKIARVDKEYRWKDYTDFDNENIPSRPMGEGKFITKNTKGEKVLRVQDSNHYRNNTPGLRLHKAKGQARKIRKRVNPVWIVETGKRPRIYFDTYKELERHNEKCGEGVKYYRKDIDIPIYTMFSPKNRGEVKNVTLYCGKGTHSKAVHEESYPKKRKVGYWERREAIEQAENVLLPACFHNTKGTMHIAEFKRYMQALSYSDNRLTDDEKHSLACEIKRLGSDRIAAIRCDDLIDRCKERTHMDALLSVAFELGGKLRSEVLAC